MEASGDWKLEQPQAEQALKERYLQWCAHLGGGDCLGLLDDAPYLRADDRRTLALAFAFGNVLDETYAALGRELLDVRALASMVVWTVALYCMMWVVPEPTTKAVAAGMTLLLMGYLGLKTVYGLMDGWARMADTAHHATTFEELRAAGGEFGRVLGEDSARAMISRHRAVPPSWGGWRPRRWRSQRREPWPGPSLPRSCELPMAYSRVPCGGAVVAS